MHLYNRSCSHGDKTTAGIPELREPRVRRNARNGGDQLDGGDQAMRGRAACLAFRKKHEVRCRKSITERTTVADAWVALLEKVDAESPKPAAPKGE